MKRFVVLSCAALTLGACASRVGQGTTSTVHMTRIGMKDAVIAPLKDFNLVRQEVPAILLEAANDPYKLPGAAECPDVEGEIRRLDLALGPDADMPGRGERQTMEGRASHAASGMALDAVRDVTTGWIPFRSTVRRLTGASHAQDRFKDAQQAGVIRRAYLKGIGLQKGCAYPAAPMPAPTKELLVAQETGSITQAAASTTTSTIVATPDELPPATMPTAAPAPPPGPPQLPPLILDAVKPVQPIPAYDPPVAPKRR